MMKFLRAIWDTIAGKHYLEKDPRREYVAVSVKPAAWTCPKCGAGAGSPVFRVGTEDIGVWEIKCSNPDCSWSVKGGSLAMVEKTWTRHEQEAIAHHRAAVFDDPDPRANACLGGDKGCGRMPPGWTCSRPAWHDGPCSAASTASCRASIPRSSR